MSFAYSRTVLEPSFQFSKKIFGKPINPKAPMRLVFPGGWENKDSEAFKWYDAQSYKFFRKLQYYKERKSVGHEFIVLPLQDVDDNPTDWFCRLERTADPLQQLAAISTNGTEAFDYIQSFDSDLLVPIRSACLVTEITLSRDFDLYDVLAVCSAIADHPLACRYTPQQYNCYFFCWAIVSSLSRRSVNWEDLTPRHIDIIKESILHSAATPVPSEGATLPHILSAVHSSETDPKEPLLAKMLVPELSSLEFSRSVCLAISSVLWAHRGQAQLNESLSGLSLALADQTIELLIGDLDVVLRLNGVQTFARRL